MQAWVCAQGLVALGQIHHGNSGRGGEPDQDSYSSGAQPWASGWMIGGLGEHRSAGTHLVAEAHVLQEHRSVPFVPWGALTAPADELTLILAEQVELLSVLLAGHLLVHLLDGCNEAAQLLVGPEAGSLERSPALGTGEHLRLRMQREGPPAQEPQDARLAVAVSTADAQGLDHQVQADGAGGLLPHLLAGCGRGHASSREAPMLGPEISRSGGDTPPLVLRSL